MSRVILSMLFANALGQTIEYRLIQEKVDWPTAVDRCPIVYPGSQFARILDAADYTNLAGVLIAGYGSSNPPADIYQGAWIGLNAIDSPDQPFPSTPGVPATGWRWVDGTNINGALATPQQLIYWGGPGTGFNGLPQPDNSGGIQRCVLIAVGAIPPTTDSPFYDDQNCGGGTIGGVDNDHWFICELSTPPRPTPGLPLPPSPPPAPTAHASKDPHFRFAHGGRADIRGKDGAVYNFLSAKNASMNVQFEAADFVWSHRTVHGTKMRKAFWTVRTPLTSELFKISVDAESVHDRKKGFHAVVLGGPSPVRVDENTPFIRPGVHVSIFDRSLTVRTTNWKFGASANSFPFAHLNKGKVLLDVEASPLYDVDADPVAPHGLFGQSFDRDDLAIDGAVDANRTDDATTTANGEGALEGTIGDYEIPAEAGPFSTDFKYSRFDVTAAKPRDVSKLTGHKHSRLASKVAAAHHNERE